MPLTMNSILIPADEAPLEELHAARKRCWSQVKGKCVELWKDARITIRDLNGTDMSYTNNIMTETSNSGANAWNAMAFGAFTVPTSTVIGIFGVRLGFEADGTVKEIPITGIRIEVGGSRKAQWNVEKLGAEFSSSANAATPMYMKLGFTPSPIIISEDLTVTIYEYTKTASKAYTIIWEGFTGEKESVTLTP